MTGFPLYTVPWKCWPERRPAHEVHRHRLPVFHAMREYGHLPLGEDSE